MRTINTLQGLYLKTQGITGMISKLGKYHIQVEFDGCV